jgi:hypothetical protein
MQRRAVLIQLGKIKEANLNDTLKSSRHRNEVCKQQVKEVD